MRTKGNDCNREGWECEDNKEEEEGGRAREGYEGIAETGQ